MHNALYASSVTTWMQKHMFWTRTSNKLYGVYHTQKIAGMLANCIVRYTLPLVGGTFEQKICHEVPTAACGAMGYGCTGPKISDMDYFDKVITVLNSDISMQDGMNPAASDGATILVGQCNDTTFLQAKFTTMLTRSEIMMVKAFNSTDNYLAWYNLDTTPGSRKHGIFIAQVHFDPDTTKCGEAIHPYLTPLSAKFMKGFDGLFGDTSTEVHGGLGWSRVKYSPRMNAIIMAETANNIKTNNVGMTLNKMGFVHAFPLGAARGE